MISYTLISDCLFDYQVYARLSLFLTLEIKIRYAILIVFSQTNTFDFIIQATLRIFIEYLFCCKIFLFSVF